MKLFMVTSISEDVKAVSAIMEKAGIKVYSVSETIGHKTEHHDYLPDNWFGKNDEGTSALFFFSFTENDKALAALELVRDYNRQHNPDFPIRAFVLPVEAASF